MASSNDVQFTVIVEEGNQQIFPFKKLESFNVSQKKKLLKHLRINIVVNNCAINRLIIAALTQHIYCQNIPPFVFTVTFWRSDNQTLAMHFSALRCCYKRTCHIDVQWRMRRRSEPRDEFYRACIVCEWQLVTHWYKNDSLMSLYPNAVCLCL